MHSESPSRQVKGLAMKHAGMKIVTMVLLSHSWFSAHAIEIETYTPWGLAEKAARGWAGGAVLFWQMGHNVFAAELNSDHAKPFSSPWQASQKIVGAWFFDGTGDRHRRKPTLGSVGCDFASHAVAAGDFPILSEQRTGLLTG
jgi:hypothetical protein